VPVGSRSTGAFRFDWTGVQACVIAMAIVGGMRMSGPVAASMRAGAISFAGSRIGITERPHENQTSTGFRG
jgi:hypothetical protein